MPIKIAALIVRNMLQYCWIGLVGVALRETGALYMGLLCAWGLARGLAREVGVGGASRRGWPLLIQSCYTHMPVKVLHLSCEIYNRIVGWRLGV